MSDRRIVDIGPMLAELKEAVKDYEACCEPLTAAEFTEDEIEDLEALPVIDPETLRPVAHWKPSVGEWVHVDDSGEVWSEPAVECSKCGGIISQSDHDSYVWNYCPVCGAKMEG